MATTDEQDLRRELQAEREGLTEAVEELRTGLGRQLRSKLPVAAAGAFVLGFLKAGGVAATARLLMRRRRN